MRRLPLPLRNPSGAACLWSLFVAIGLQPLLAFAQPDPAADRMKHGLELLRNENYEEAAREFQAALVSKPMGDRKIGELNFYLGLVRQMQAAKSEPAARDRMLEEARQAFAKATELRPDSAGSWNNLALVSDRLGDKNAAARAFQKAIESGTGEQTTYLLNYAAHLEATGRTEDALRFFSEAALQEPFSAQAREGINRHFLNRDGQQLLLFLWRLFDEGHIEWAEDVALQGLELPPDASTAPQLLNCIVRCLARQAYQPQKLQESHTGKRLGALTAHPFVGKGAQEVLLLHGENVPQPFEFAWWPKQVGRELAQPTPLGGWPYDGFTELTRALGRWEETHKNDERAEQYYRLAYRLSPAHLDPRAVVSLADLWMKKDQKRKLEQFFREEEGFLFEGKSEAIERRDHQRTYEMHRALALVYAYLNQWESGEAARNAEFQIKEALKDANLFNQAATARNSPERIADWQLVDKLANRYDELRQPAKAFDLRVTKAKEFQTTGKSAEAATVVRPLVDKSPPPGANTQTIRDFETLKAEFKEGFPRGPKVRDETKLQIRTPGGGDLNILVRPPQEFGGQPEQLKSLLEHLIGESNGRPGSDRPARPTDVPVRLLPKTDQAKNVERVQFDGRHGAIEMKVDGKSVNVPFSLDAAHGDASARSFRYVKP